MTTSALRQSSQVWYSSPWTKKLCSNFAAQQSWMGSLSLRCSHRVQISEYTRPLERTKWQQEELTEQLQLWRVWNSEEAGQSADGQKLHYQRCWLIHPRSVSDHCWLTLNCLLFERHQTFTDYHNIIFKFQSLQLCITIWIEIRRKVARNCSNFIITDTWPNQQSHWGCLALKTANTNILQYKFCQPPIVSTALNIVGGYIICNDLFFADNIFTTKVSSFWFF